MTIIDSKKNIGTAKRKLPAAVVALLVYISYCAAGWYIMRGNLAYVGFQYGMPGWIVNDVVAFFLGGLIPFLLYTLLASSMQRSLVLKTGGDIASVKHVLDFAVITANLILFALKFMYLALPLYASVIDMIINPAVTLVCVGICMVFVFRRNYVDKTRFKLVFAQVMSAFVIVYGLITLLNLILAVM